MTAHDESPERTRRPQAPPVVLYADDAILVVDKPPGLSTVPGRSGPESLIALLRATIQIGGDELRVVHRLDNETSGVVLVARTLDAQRILTEQFEARTVRKRYLVLIAGRPAEDRGFIDAPIAIRQDGSGLVRIDSHSGKAARTDWEMAETFRGFALLACHPQTGRTHQIRVHLAHAGTPLAVDPDYEGGRMLMLSDFKTDYRPNRRRPERPLLDRLSLHAESIEFVHPTTQKSVTFQSDPPKDFAVTLKQLRKYAS